MRNEKEESRRLDRRRFLQGAGLAVGAAGATSANACENVIVAMDDSKPKQAGYRETEDVRTYYRLARI